MLLNQFFLFISGVEIAVILFIAVLVMGTDKIPEFARSLGKGINEIKDIYQATNLELLNNPEEDKFIFKNADKLKDATMLYSGFDKTLINLLVKNIKFNFLKNFNIFPMHELIKPKNL